MFHSSFSSKRNGVVILIHKNLNFTLIKQVKDNQGRMICLQANINGKNIILCNIYAPTIGDPNFFHYVNNTLGEMEGDIILAGDFNQVWDAFIDRSQFTGPSMVKDRAAIHMLSEDNSLIDIWRLTNPNEREYTFFPNCHKTYSRIDMILISNSMTRQVLQCKIHAIALSDHAAVELGIDINNDNERKGRWRHNTSLLLNETFKLSIKVEFMSFFEINKGSTNKRSTE